MRRHNLFLGAAVLGCMTCQSADLMAQETDAVNADQIVVTAQKRTERLQDVPLAVSAVTADQLEDRGILSAADLRYVAPSVNYGSSANTRGEGLSIRGVGTQIFGDGVEQSVGVVVDGVPMGRNAMGIADMFDVERLEVLRGPQGMLFGKNASAGLVHVITREPQLGENTVAARVSYATLNDLQVAATGNVALGESAALRVTYQSRERDGFVRNITRREDLGEIDNENFRVRFKADVSPTLQFLLSADYANSNTLCCTWTARSAPTSTPFGALNAGLGIVPSPTNLANAAGARFYQNQDFYGASAQVNWDLGWATLTGIGAYRYWYAEDNNDPDLLPINILDRNNGDSTLDQNSLEVRLSSPGEQTVEWTVGLFLFDMTNDGGNTQAGTLGVALPPGATLGSTRRSVTYNDSAAVFGQVGWNVTDDFKLTAGARYTDESLAVDYVGGPASGTIAPIPGRFNGSTAAKIDTTNTSWRVTAQYNFTDDVMAYAGAARGYKGPAYDQAPVTSTIVFARPEIPTSYEAGLRSTLFDGTTIFNAALFQTTFKNFQAQVFDQNVFPSRFTTANAGELETKGVELELQTRPFEGLSLNGNAAFIDAVYTDFKNVACYLGQPQLPFGTPRTSPRQCIAQSLGANFVTEGTGNQLTNSPEWTANFAINYERSLGPIVGFGQINYYYRDEVSFSAAGDPNGREDAYGLLGAQIGVSAQDDRWRLTVFGRNLTDEHFVNTVIGQPVLGAPGVYSQFPSADARRIVGVALEVRFGD